MACVSQPLPSKLAEAEVKGLEGLMVSHVRGRHIHLSPVFAVPLSAWSRAALSLHRLAWRSPTGTVRGIVEQGDKVLVTPRPSQRSVRLFLVFSLIFLGSHVEEIQRSCV